MRDAGAAHPASDEDVEAAKSGDEAAFRRLYRSTQPGLERYVGVLVGAEAEDVCAEAWLQASRDLCRFSGDLDAFRGWIARIARNRAIDLIRAQQRRPVDLTDDIGVFEYASAPSAEENTLVEISTDEAIRLIASLPRDQAEAVVLRAVMGFDAVTAGKVLGKRPGAVRTAAYRGLRTLARRLDEPR